MLIISHPTQKFNRPKITLDSNCKPPKGKISFYKTPSYFEIFYMYSLQISAH